MGDAEPRPGIATREYDRPTGMVRFNLVSEGVSGMLTPFTLTVEAASKRKPGR